MREEHVWGTLPDFVGPRHAFRERLLLSRFLAAEPGREVLNVGAGQGTFTNLLAERGFDVTSTDVSPAALDVLMARVAGPVHLADATRLPFAEASFDAVVLGEVLEHIEEDALALREAHRVLGPGGTLALSVPRNPAWFSAGDRWAGHVRRYTRSGLLAAVEGASFHVLAFTPWGFPFASAYHRTVYEWTIRRGRVTEPNVRGRRLAQRILAALLQLDRCFVGVEFGALGYILVARAVA